MTAALRTIPAILTPAGFEQIDDLSAAVGLTPPDGCVLALIQATGKAVTWRDDGVDPTSSVGMLLSDGALMEYAGALHAIKFIETDASAILNVTYYR